MVKRSQKRFTMLIAPLAGRIQSYAQYLAWNQNDVEDIFQTALLNAYSKFDAFEEGSNFKAWIYKFVTYAAYNFNRKHKHIAGQEILTEVEEILSTAEEENPTLEAFSDSKEYDQFLKKPDMILPEFSLEVQRAMKQLPEKRRSIFLLRTIGDFSYKEIAELCDVPQGSVMSEIFRARKILREALRNQKSTPKDFTKREGDPNAM